MRSPPGVIAPGHNIVFSFFKREDKINQSIAKYRIKVEHKKGDDHCHKAWRNDKPIDRDKKKQNDRYWEKGHYL